MHLAISTTMVNVYLFTYRDSVSLCTYVTHTGTTFTFTPDTTSAAGSLSRSSSLGSDHDPQAEFEYSVDDSGECMMGYQMQFSLGKRKKWYNELSVIQLSRLIPPHLCTY